MGGRDLRTGRMHPHSDTDRAPDVGVLAREHAGDITFRPESPPFGAWMTGWRRTGGQIH